MGLLNQSDKKDTSWDAFALNRDESDDSDDEEPEFKPFGGESMNFSKPSPASFSPFISKSKDKKGKTKPKQPEKSDPSDSSSQTYDPFSNSLPPIHNYSTETSEEFSEDIPSEESQSSQSKPQLSLEEINRQFLESLSTLRTSGIAENALMNTSQLLQKMPEQTEEEKKEMEIQFDPNLAKTKIPPPPRFSRTTLGAELRSTCQQLLNYTYVFNT